jgi:predicted GNAT family acetyltransferase
MQVNMRIRTYNDAEAFLGNTREVLESKEAANSLILGICGRLVRHPEQIEAAPYLRTVEDEHGLVLSAMMTPPHNLVVCGHQGDFQTAARTLTEDLAGGGWAVPGVFGPGEVAQEVAQCWTETTGGRYRVKERLRVYELRQVISPAPERGRLRPATHTDIALVSRWRHAFHVEIFGTDDAEKTRRATRSRIEQEDIFLWEDGQPVSMAMKTRPTRRGISVTLVYTPPEFRRRGYATACVSELSRMLLETGWEFCALFAQIANPTANRLYQRIGYRPVCDYDQIVFLEESTG